MKPVATLITLVAAISSASSTLAQDIPTRPVDLAEWALSEMTCVQFLTIPEEGDAATSAGGELATLIAFAYMRGVDRVLGLDPGTSLFQATVNCLGQPDLAFSEAPFNPD